MINNAVKRSVLRWTHLFFSIPILSYIYGPPAQVQQYAGAVRFIFVPLIVLSGFWMFAGIFWAIMAAALWLCGYYLAGFWAGVLSQVVLFTARKIWLVTRARHSK